MSQDNQSPVTPGVPHSREAEEAVCGAVIINPEAYFYVSQFLVADDFYIRRNKWIWEAFTALHTKRTSIDLLTLSEELQQHNRLEEVGSSSYLTSLINQVPTSLNAESYGRIVEENSIRRKMIFSANKIASLAYKSGDIYSSHAEGRKIYESALTTKGDFHPIRKLASEHYDRMDKRSRGQDVDVLKTGFMDIDGILDGGLRGDDFVIIGGRPGMGKTAFVLDVAKNVATEYPEKNVGVFSLEMSKEQYVDRWVTKYGIPMKSIRTGRVLDREWPIYTHAIEELSELKIWIDDVPNITPSRLRAKAHTLYNMHGLDLLILDYIGLMEGDKRNDNRNNEVSELSRAMKILARELHIPVVCAAQLNRNVETRQDKRPMLSDLRDSGSLEQDADIVMFLYRDEVYNKDTTKYGVAEVNIAKQRNGETNTAELIFRHSLMKFENAASKVFRPNESPHWQDRD